MRLFRRAERAPDLILDAAALRRGEKVLAFARAEPTWVLGTRLALIVVEPGAETRRLGWEQIQAADWDKEAAVLRVSEVGEYGSPRATYSFALEDPVLLLQLIRERVTASVVLQRGFPVDGTRGFKVIGRRSPSGGAVVWMHEYDAGIDPEDPVVAEAAEKALAECRADVGD